MLVGPPVKCLNDIFMKFCTDMHAMKPDDVYESLTLHVALSAGQNFNSTQILSDTRAAQMARLIHTGAYR